MSAFTSDVEFIQFLKNISLYVTDDESGTIGARGAEGQSNTLYKNLEFLRQRF
jgi:hypothetical protein